LDIAQRGPPTDWEELVQPYVDRAIFQATPEELPVIDIHSLREPPSRAQGHTR
jgi:hypothetical protein